MLYTYGQNEIPLGIVKWLLQCGDNIFGTGEANKVKTKEL